MLHTISTSRSWLAAVACLAFLAAPSLSAASRAQETPAEQQQDAAPSLGSPREVVEALNGVYEFERTGDTGALARATSAIAEPDAGLASREAAERLAIRLGRVFDRVAKLDPARVEGELVPKDYVDRAQWSVRPASD